MKGMPGGISGLMKQANQMQMRMKKTQEELAKKEYETSAGGGAVKIKINGDHQILSLVIDPEVIKSGDVEMLQDLVITACNDVIKTAKTESNREMEKLSGGLQIPGLF
ncbi:MAG: YbaB/EbfC family nucleoid-associated protein [Pseudobdellovibrionaceae bacterium]|jgi:DNA-binding YbaB/EbfC family protein